MGETLDLCPKCAATSYSQIGPRRVPLIPLADALPKTARQKRLKA